MKQFNTFYIKESEFDINKLVLRLNYSFDNEVFFVEEIDFGAEGFEFRKNLSKEIINNITFHLSIAFGISYYKAFPTQKIIVENGNLDEKAIDFWIKFYRNGLGEFLFKNKINPSGLFQFESKNGKMKTSSNWNLEEKAIVPIGGGKDSCVAIEKISKSKIDFDLFTFSTKDNVIFEQTTQIADKKRLFIKRQISQELFKLNEQGYYNGHIPITGLISFALIFSSYLYGYKYIVLANEHSANYGNLEYEGVQINHQYSKSLEFENDLRDYINRYLSLDLEYFSILRNVYEISICKEFSFLEKYFDVFTSCNGNFKINKKGVNSRWCLDCPKCGFVFACLHPYLDESKIIEIFGSNMYEDEGQVNLFDELLGISGNKPFECVGTNEEVILSMYYSYSKNENNDKLPIILRNFENKILPKLNKEKLEQLEKKLFGQYENNIPKILL